MSWSYINNYLNRYVTKIRIFKLLTIIYNSTILTRLLVAYM